MDRMRQTRNFDRTQMQDLRSAINYIIEKDYPKQNITLKTELAEISTLILKSSHFNGKY